MKRWLRRPLAGAAAIGVLAGLAVAFFLVTDAVETEGSPTEHARVVATEDTGGFFDGCGRNGGPARDLTLRSDEPSPGLASEFVLEGECYVEDADLGEVREIVRVVGDDGEVTIYSSPMAPDDAIRASLMSAGGCFVLASAVLCGRAAWRRSQERPPPNRYDAQ